MFVNNVLLPPGQLDAAVMFLPWPVLRKEAWPMFRIALNGDTSGPRHGVNFSGEESQHGVLTSIDETGPTRGAVDPQHGQPRRGYEVAVAQVEAEKVCVGGQIVGIPRWVGAPWTSCSRGLAFLASSCPLAVEPIADRPARQSKITTDVAKWDAGGAHLKGLFTNVWWMHPSIVEQGYDKVSGCRGRESNPHALSGK